nr:voltage-dependent calcium channel subunit alpha-2/delta-2-like [Oncorhynchus nerka]
MAICAQSYGIFCLFSIQTILIISLSSPATGSLRFPQHYTMMHWAGRIEKELEKTIQLVTGTQQIRGIYNEKKSQFDIKRNNPKDLVERVARDIAKLLTSKRRALERQLEVQLGCCIPANQAHTPINKGAT